MTAISNIAETCTLVILVVIYFLCSVLELPIPALLSINPVSFMTEVRSQGGGDDPPPRR